MISFLKYTWKEDRFVFWILGCFITAAVAMAFAIRHDHKYYRPKRLEAHDRERRELYRVWVKATGNEKDLTYYEWAIMRIDEMERNKAMDNEGACFLNALRAKRIL